MIIAGLFTSLPGRVWSVAMSVCAFVCLSVCPSHIAKTTGPNYAKFSMHVDYGRSSRSSSGSVAICHTLPVLWMTSRYHIMGPMSRHVYSWAAMALRNSRNYRTDSNQILQVLIVIVTCAPGVKFVIYDCLVCSFANAFHRVLFR